MPRQPRKRRPSPQAPGAVWAAVTDRANAHYRARMDSPDARRSMTEVTAARDADPVGNFLRNAWVAWARWQHGIGEWQRIETLLEVANGRQFSPRDALALSSGTSLPSRGPSDGLQPGGIDRQLWRTRLHLIAAAQNDQERSAVARDLVPPLIREVADNAVFVVDQDSHSHLRFKLLEQSSSTAALSYATLLLLEIDGPGSTLCECQLPSCGRFFFPEAKRKGTAGRRKRSYCAEHREEGERLKTAARGRTFREKERASKTSITGKTK